MNRGIARRTVFEDVRDIRYFLSCLAREVRAGTLEVHAYSILTTHFHLLVRSPEGELGPAMGRVLNKYVRYFNRGRRRDGALFRGRFRSRPVTTEAYQRLLVRYIDFNPVEAGLVDHPFDYPHGSARHHVRSIRPRWLERTWIRDSSGQPDGAGIVEAFRYANAFGEPLTEGMRNVVDRRMANASKAPDPLDELLRAAPSSVLDWMRRKAALADGTAIGIPVCDVLDVRRAVEMQRNGLAWTVQSAHGGRPKDVWLLIENALLRDLSASTCREISSVLAKTASWSADAYRMHRTMLAEAPYAEAASRAAAKALELAHAVRRPVSGLLSA
jgi:REP element-mobilizing transposase RayT